MNLTDEMTCSTEKFLTESFRTHPSQKAMEGAAESFLLGGVALRKRFCKTIKGRTITARRKRYWQDYFKMKRLLHFILLIGLFCLNLAAVASSVVISEIMYNPPDGLDQLRNIIERMLVLHGREDKIEAKNLPSEFHGGETGSISHAMPVAMSGATLQESVNIYEKHIIEEALLEAGGVQTRAADMLGCTRRILRYRMEKLGLM